jgi:hypothetical protein
VPDMSNRMSNRPSERRHGFIGTPEERWCVSA